MVSVRASTSGTEADATIVLTKPVGTVAGDLLLAIVLQDTFGSPTGLTPATGFAQTGETFPGNIDAKAWTKTAGDSEPASYSFGASRQGVGFLLAITGHDPSTPINVIPAWADGEFTASHVASSITPTAGSCLLVCMWGMATGTTGTRSHTTPGGMTELHDLGVGNIFASCCVEALTTGANVATGTRTATSINEPHSTMSLAVAPVPTETIGALSASAPMPVAALTGTVPVTGQLAATAPLPTTSVSAAVSAAGALAAQSPLPTAALAVTGTVTAPGILTVTAPAPVVALGGAVAVAGQLTAQAPLPVVALRQAPAWPPRAGSVTVRRVGSAGEVTVR